MKKMVMVLVVLVVMAGVAWAGELIGSRDSTTATIDQGLAIKAEDFLSKSVIFEACKNSVEFNKDVIDKMTEKEVVNLILLIDFYVQLKFASDELGCSVAKKLLPKFFK